MKNDTMLRRDEDHRDHEELRGCFYRGHVRTNEQHSSVTVDQRSAVAVDLCDGMVSTFQTFPIRSMHEDV